MDGYVLLSLFFPYAAAVKKFPDGFLFLFFPSGCVTLSAFTHLHPVFFLLTLLDSQFSTSLWCFGLCFSVQLVLRVMAVKGGGERERKGRLTHGFGMSAMLSSLLLSPWLR